METTHKSNFKESQNKKNFKYALFEYYYLLISNSADYTILSIILLIIEASQINLLIIFQFNFNPVNSPLLHKSNSVENIQNSESLEFKDLILFFERIFLTFIKPGEFALVTITIKIIMAILALMLGYLAFHILINYGKKKSTFKPHSLLFGLQYHLFLFMNIVFFYVISLPTFILVMSIYQCKEVNLVDLPNLNGGIAKKLMNYPEINCDENSQNIAFATMTFLLSLLIYILNGLLLYTKNSKATFFLVVPSKSNRVFIYLTLKLILGFFYSMTFPLHPTYDIKIFLCFGLIILIIILRFSQPVFLISRMFSTEIILEGTFLFNSAMSIAVFYANIQYTVAMLVSQIFFSILFGVLLLYIFKLIQRYFLLLPDDSNMPAYKAFNKYILLFNEARKFKTLKRSRFVFLGEVENHCNNCLNEECLCRAYLPILLEVKFKFINQDIVDDKYFRFSKHTLRQIHHLQKSKNSLDLKVGSSKSPDDRLNTHIDDLELAKNSKSFKTKPIEKGSNKFSFKNIAWNIDDSTNHIIDKSLYGMLEIILEKYTKEHSNEMPGFHFAYAYLMTYYMDNVYKALFEIMQINENKRTFLDNYEIFYLNSEIEKILLIDYLENQNSKNYNIDDIIRYNELLVLSLSMMEKTMNEMIGFWSEIRINRNGLKLYQKALNIFKFKDSVRDTFEELIFNLHFKNIDMLNIYYEFLEIVNSDQKDRIGTFINKISMQENDEELKKYISGINLNVYNVLDDVGIMIISGDLKEVGRILQTNIMMTDILRYSKDELINCNVSKIMPNYFGKMHDDFIKRYLETAKRNILNKVRFIIAKNKVGFCIPVFLYTRLVPNLFQSVRFIGMIKFINKYHPTMSIPPGVRGSNNISLILTKYDGKLCGINKSSLNTFGITLNSIAEFNIDESKGLNIQSILPELDLSAPRILRKLKSDNGLYTILKNENLRGLFEDYREVINCSENSSVLNQVNKIYMNMEDVFKDSQNVLVFMSQINFENERNRVYIFKIIKLFDKLEDYHNQSTPYLLEHESLNNSKEKDQLVSKALLESMNRNQRDLIPLKRGKKTSHNLDQLMMHENRMESCLNPNELMDNFYARKRDTSDIPKASTENARLKEFNDKKSNKKKFSVLKNISLKKYSELLISKFDRIVRISLLLLFITATVNTVLSVLSIQLLHRLDKYLYLLNNRNILLSSINSIYDLTFRVKYGLVNISDASQFSDFGNDKLLNLMNMTVSNLTRTCNLLYNMADFNEMLKVDVLDIIELDTYYLANDYTVNTSTNNFYYLVNSITAKVQETLYPESYKNLTLDKLLYDFQRSKYIVNSPIYQVNNIIQEFYFIRKNTQMEMLKKLDTVNMLIGMNLGSRNIGDLNSNIFLIILPFLIWIISYFLFFWVLSDINSHKVKILKIFFLLDFKFGYEIIEKCKNFNMKYIQNMHNELDSDTEGDEEDHIISEDTVHEEISDFTIAKSRRTPSVRSSSIMSRRFKSPEVNIKKQRSSRRALTSSSKFKNSHTQFVFRIHELDGSDLIHKIRNSKSSTLKKSSVVTSQKALKTNFSPVNTEDLFVYIKNRQSSSHVINSISKNKLLKMQNEDTPKITEQQSSSESDGDGDFSKFKELDKNRLNNINDLANSHKSSENEAKVYLNSAKLSKKFVNSPSKEILEDKSLVCLIADRQMEEDFKPSGILKSNKSSKTLKHSDYNKFPKLREEIDTSVKFNEEEQIEKEDDDNDIELSKNQFRKHLLFVYLKISILMIIIISYFFIVIFKNDNFKKKNNILIQGVSMISSRGWFVNNMISSFIELSHQPNPKCGREISTNKTITEIDNYCDLFDFYSNSVDLIQNNLRIYFSNDIPYPYDLKDTHTALDSPFFCKAVENFYTSSFNTTDCLNFPNNYTKLGISDSVNLIKSTLQRKRNTIPSTSNETFAENLLNDWFLNIFILLNSKYLNAANEILHNLAGEFIARNFDNEAKFRISFLCGYFFLLIILLLLFCYVTRLLKEMLDKDQAILNIVPSEIIESNEKVMIALMNMHN